MIAVDAMAHLDRCRRPALERRHRATSASGSALAKEWHHVVVHGPELSLLVNLSESATSDGPVARTIVMAHDEHHWYTSLTTAAASDVAIATDRLDAHYGQSTRLAFDDGAYHLSASDSTEGYDIDLVLRPQSPASMLTGVTLSRTEKLSWFFVPRLQATGRVTLVGDTTVMTDAPAYHDHNWGRFDWGGDYAWEWISIVADDWSVTASRLLNGSRTRVTSQYLHLETAGEAVTFRDHEIEVASHGRQRFDDAPVVPGVMRLLTPALVEDVPATMRWSARRGAQTLDLRIEPASVARLVMPSERAVDRVVVLAESLGEAQLTGTINGRDLSGLAPAIVELLR